MVLITIDQFRIVEAAGGIYSEWGAERYRIEHNCKPFAGDNKPWYAYAYNIYWKGSTCSACHKAPPEGMQAMFWFLKDE